MARKYSSSEVKALLRKHRELYARFGQLDALAQRSKAEIQAAASKITAESTAKLLETVDVDELSRRKKGIRVKSLHDAGFNTIADILRANSMQISSINGISPEGAKEIKRIAVSIANTAQRSAKIRLSADDKNPDSTALVQEISAYILRKDSLRDYYKLQETFKPKTDAAENSLINVGNGVRWLFYNSNQKAEVTQAYQYLVRLQKSDYAANLKQLSNNIRGNSGGVGGICR